MVWYGKTAVSEPSCSKTTLLQKHFWLPVMFGSAVFIITKLEFYVIINSSSDVVWLSTRVAYRLKAAALWVSPPWLCLPGMVTPSWWARRAACWSDAPFPARRWLQCLPKVRAWHPEPRQSSRSGFAVAPSTPYTSHPSTGNSLAYQTYTGTSARCWAAILQVNQQWPYSDLSQEPVCECGDWWCGPPPLTAPGQPAAFCQSFRLLRV